MNMLRRAMEALLAPSAEELAAREAFRAESMAKLREQVERDYPIPAGWRGIETGLERARGPVACADCWQIVDDAPIGCSILCLSCREEALVGRS